MNACQALHLAVALATGLLLWACGTPQNAVERIGVYDSRSIAVAWAGTKSHNDLMKAFQTEWQQAKAAGDQKRVEEMEAEAEAQQRLLHLQAFSTAPVDDILAHIEDSLAEIKKEAGVTLLVSKWDTETLAQYPSAEQVDVTTMLVDALHPNERQRQIAITIQEREPIPLEEAEKIEDW
jgi:hypothetical protein